MRTCSNCKHATYYVAYWWYPWLDPKCEISKMGIVPDGSCDMFEMIGRLSR